MRGVAIVSAVFAVLTFGYVIVINLPAEAARAESNKSQLEAVVFAVDNPGAVPPSVLQKD